MEIFCILIACAALLFAAMCLYRTNKTVARLDGMLSSALDGAFTENGFDESVSSRLEAKMARFLNGSAASARRLAEERGHITALIADISHQTKTPIANVLLYASLLAEGETDESRLSEARELRAQAEKLSFLVGALVKASRLESGMFSVRQKENALLPIMRSCAAQISAKAGEKNIEILVTKSGAGAFCDAKWTAEALANLIDNAVKYTPAGGRVEISAGEYDFFSRIDVADNGAGIAEGEIAHLFTRFYRGVNASETEGVGLGLYLAREIASAQGGYIKVASQIGRGSTFSLFLPRDGSNLTKLEDS